MKVVNLREHQQYKERAVAYFQEKWANERSKPVYEDCISRSLVTDCPLPIWYILLDGDDIIGCVGLITNDFISAMDLWPWLVALYIEEKHRGNNYASLLVEAVKVDAVKANFSKLYLATDHVGYYEKFDFNYITDAYHPWGDVSRVYEYELQNDK